MMNKIMIGDGKHTARLEQSILQDSFEQGEWKWDGGYYNSDWPMKGRWPYVSMNKLQPRAHISAQKKSSALPSLSTCLYIHNSGLIKAGVP
jgi:hypothetical protein